MGKFLKKLGPLKVESPVSKNKENETRSAIDCDHIFGDIYISDYATAQNLQFLKKEKFTHIVVCAASCLNQFEDHFQYCRIELNDKVNQSLIQPIQQFIAFIEDSPPYEPAPFTAPPILSSQGFGFTKPSATPLQRKVLVHCKQGKSRAPIVVCGYIVWKMKISFMKALDLVRSKRAKVDPNFGFLLKGLHDFQRHFGAYQQDLQRIDETLDQIDSLDLEERVTPQHLINEMKLGNFSPSLSSEPTQENVMKKYLGIQKTKTEQEKDYGRMCSGFSNFSTQAPNQSLRQQEPLDLDSFLLQNQEEEKQQQYSENMNQFFSEDSPHISKKRMKRPTDYNPFYVLPFSPEQEQKDMELDSLKRKNIFQMSERMLSPASPFTKNS